MAHREEAKTLLQNEKIKKVAKTVAWAIAVIIGIVFLWKTIVGEKPQVAAQLVAPAFQRPVQEVVYSIQKAEVVAASSSTLPAEFTVHLIGEDQWSTEAVNVWTVAAMVPEGAKARCSYNAPPGTQARFGDGTPRVKEGPLDGTQYGIYGGKTRFKGPAGEVVVVTCDVVGSPVVEKKSTEAEGGEQKGYPSQDPREVFAR